MSESLQPPPALLPDPPKPSYPQGPNGLADRPVDPTVNVRELVDLNVRRLDDLRAAEARLVEAHLLHVEAISELRANYNAQLREAEAKRIDAIRSVDVGNVQRAAEVQAIQANTLAAQVVASAETQRAQVTAAATAAATSLAAALVPIQDAIADLRRAQYEAQGQRTQVVETRSASGAMMALIGLAITILMTVITVGGIILTKGG